MSDALNEKLSRFHGELLGYRRYGLSEEFQHRTAEQMTVEILRDEYRENHGLKMIERRKRKAISRRA